MQTNTVMLCSPHSMPVLRVSLPVLISHGVKPIVYSCGAAVADEVEQMGAYAVRLPEADGGDYGSEGFSPFIGRKFDAILAELVGANVLFLDADVLAFSDPTQDIDEDCDIFAQDDWAEPIASRGPQICTGCWWIRSCPENRTFLAKSKKLTERPPEFGCWCDEAVVNLLARDTSLRVKFADRNVWQNGMRWNCAGRTGSPHLLHLNGTGHFTTEDKLSAMRYAIEMLSPQFATASSSCHG